MNEENFTPRRCFHESRRHVILATVWSARLCYYSAKWLFTKFPNIIWPLILAAVILSSVVTIMRERHNRDLLNLENAVLQDSLNKLTGKPIRYTTLSGQPVNPLPPQLPKKNKED